MNWEVTQIEKLLKLHNHFGLSSTGNTVVCPDCWSDCTPKEQSDGDTLWECEHCGWNAYTSDIEDLGVRLSGNDECRMHRSLFSEGYWWDDYDGEVKKLEKGSKKYYEILEGFDADDEFNDELGYENLY